MKPPVRPPLKPMPIWRIDEKFYVRVAHNDDSGKFTAEHRHVNHHYAFSLVQSGGDRARYEVLR